MQADMLIIEDVLLLMLDDRTGASSGAGTQHLTLASAVLVELALLGRIRRATERGIAERRSLRQETGHFLTRCCKRHTTR